MSYKISINFKRPFIWLKRFRHRCGYGVHSPFAFGFITDIVYERLDYYCYSHLHKEVTRQMHEHPKSWSNVPERVNKLLFRIANYRQPEVILTLGEPNSSSLYMQAARHSTALLSAATPTDNLPSGISQVDLLYINAKSASETESFFNKAAPLLTQQSICILTNIYSSSEMRQYWEHLKDKEIIGITFDLYDIGIIFFDKKKIKQHYIVNF